MEGKTEFALQVTIHQDGTFGIESVNKIFFLLKIDDKLLELADTIQALEKERDEEAGGVLKDIEKRLVVAQNDDTKIQSSLQHKKEAVNNEKKNKKAVEKSYTEVKNERL